MVIFGTTETLLGIFLCSLGVGHRANRAMALGLVLFGVALFGFGIGALRGGAPGGFWDRVSVYPELAAPFALFYFASVYPHPRPWLPRGRSAALLFLLPVLALEIPYLLDHSLYFGSENPGPLLIAEAFLLEPGVAAVGLVFAWDYLRLEDGPVRKSVYLLSLGLVGFSAFNGIAGLVESIRAGSFLGIKGGGGLEDVLQLGLVAAALVLVLRSSRRPRPELSGRDPARFAIVVAAAFASGLTPAILLPLPGAYLLYAAFFLFWTMFQPFIVTYALAKYQLFGLDFRLKRAIQGGTLATIFLAVFLIATQLAEEYAKQFFGANGWIAGAVAGGLLLFALHPLQAMSARIAAQAMPGAKPLREMTIAERRDFYQQQVLFAWSDGHLSRDERRMLEFTRRRLEIGPAEAARIERDVAAP